MTEEQWLQCRNPHDLLDFFQEASERKLRLFSAACCRRVWSLLIDSRSRKAIDVSERFADGLTPTEDMFSAAREAQTAADELDVAEEPLLGAANAATAATLAIREPTCYDPGFYPADHQLVAETIALVGLGGDKVAKLYLDPEITNDFSKKVHEEKAIQIRFLHDIFGNPYRSVTADPSWLSWNDGAISRLVQPIYEERILPAGTLDSARLLILADALEEAGCTDQQILTHLRSGGEHYRGCWVIDLLLSKQ